MGSGCNPNPRALTTSPPRSRREEICCNIVSGTTTNFTNGWRRRTVLNRRLYRLRAVAALLSKRPSAKGQKPTNRDVRKPRSGKAGSEPEGPERRRASAPTAMKPNSISVLLRSAFGKMKAGAQASNPLDDQFSRRVEMDRSWTIYHVTPACPRRVDGLALTSLGGSAATDGMISLNRRNVKRQKERNAQP